MRHASRTARMWIAAAATLLGACASGPPVPDWQDNAKSALDRGTAAYLAGDTRVADVEFERARSEIARTAASICSHAPS